VELRVSIATVKLEVQRILKTLGVANRSEVSRALAASSPTAD